MLDVSDAYSPSTFIPKLSDVQRDSVSDLLWLQYIADDITSGAMSAEEGMETALATYRAKERADAPGRQPV